MTGWVRIRDIGVTDLTADEKIELVAAALTELGVARALVMIHGVDHGLARYVELGGRVRFDGDEPVIALPERRAA